MSPRKLTTAPIFPFRNRKESAGFPANVSCTKCAMLTGFDEAPPSIMELVGRQ